MSNLEEMTTNNLQMAVNSRKVICGKVIKAIIKVMEPEEEAMENCTDYR